MITATSSTSSASSIANTLGTNTNNSTNATNSTSATAGSASMNAAQDRFLKLLVAQLNNQDPMNPLDNAQMTSQMAQINTVTGIQQVNDTLKSMSAQYAAMQVMQGSSMVGRDVLIDGNTLTIQNGKAGGVIDLAANAESVKIDIVSPGGQVLDTINLGAQDAGRHPFEWDASGYKGTGSPSYKVTATQGGQAIDNTTMTRATVVSVGSDTTGMKLQLQGQASVAYGGVKAIL